MPVLMQPVDSFNPETPLAPVLSEQQRIEAFLQRRLGSRVRNLRVHLRPTGLVIQGHAATYHVKQLAQHAAMELASTPILANEIEVQ